jgi:hypothetical protein
MLLDIPHERRPPLEQLLSALASSVGNGFVFIVTDRPEAAGGDDFNRLSLYIGAPSEEAEGDHERRRRREARARTVIDWVARNATTLDWIPSSRLQNGAEESALLLNITLLPPTPAISADGEGSQNTAAIAAGAAAGILALLALVLLVVRLRRQRQPRVANSMGRKSAPKSGKRARVVSPRSDAPSKALTQMHGAYLGRLTHNPAFTFTESFKADGGWMTHNPIFYEDSSDLRAPAYAAESWLDGDGGDENDSIYETVSSAPAHSKTSYDSLASRQPGLGGEYIAIGEGRCGATVPSYNRLSRVQNDRYQVVQAAPCEGIYTEFEATGASVAESSSMSHSPEEHDSHLYWDPVATDPEGTYAQPIAVAPYNLGAGCPG